MCQKRAALDVVYQRLDKIGLVKYVALLHDPNKDRKALYQHIERLLKSNATLNSLDQGADSALIYCCQQIDDIRTRQNSIVTALSKKYFGAVSIHQLYSVAKPSYLPKLDLSGIAEKIEYPILTQVLETARNLEYPRKKFDIPTNYPWRHRKDFSKISFVDKNKLLNLIDELITLTNERDRCILTYDSNDQQELFESLNERTTILNHFCDIETSCKKFDVPEHPWFNRSNFSTLTLNEKRLFFYEEHYI